MQTLNVCAGQSEAEYVEAQEQQRADLLAESKQAANFFFVAAGVAALGTGLLPLRLGLGSLGIFDMVLLYGGSLGALYGVMLLVLPCLWLLVLIGLGFAGRAGQRWAFLAGIALYALDMMALVPLFSMWAFGVHAFFVYQWWQGQRALKELEPEA